MPKFAATLDRPFPWATILSHQEKEKEPVYHWLECSDDESVKSVVSQPRKRVRYGVPSASDSAESDDNNATTSVEFKRVDEFEKSPSEQPESDVDVDRLYTELDAEMGRLVPVMNDDDEACFDDQLRKKTREENREAASAGVDIIMRNDITDRNGEETLFPATTNITSEKLFLVSAQEHTHSNEKLFLDESQEPIDRGSVDHDIDREQTACSGGLSALQTSDPSRHDHDEPIGQGIKRKYHEEVESPATQHFIRDEGIASVPIFQPQIDRETSPETAGYTFRPLETLSDPDSGDIDEDAYYHTDEESVSGSPSGQADRSELQEMHEHKPEIIEILSSDEEGPSLKRQRLSQPPKPKKQVVVHRYTHRLSLKAVAGHATAAMQEDFSVIYTSELHSLEEFIAELPEECALGFDTEGDGMITQLCCLQTSKILIFCVPNHAGRKYRNRFAISMSKVMGSDKYVKVGVAAIQDAIKLHKGYNVVSRSIFDINFLGDDLMISAAGELTRAHRQAHRDGIIVIREDNVTALPKGLKKLFSNSFEACFSEVQPISGDTYQDPGQPFVGRRKLTHEEKHAGRKHREAYIGPWANYPLPANKLTYAAKDAIFGIYIYNKMLVKYTADELASLHAKADAELTRLRDRVKIQKPPKALKPPKSQRQSNAQRTDSRGKAKQIQSKPSKPQDKKGKPPQPQKRAKSTSTRTKQTPRKSVVGNSQSTPRQSHPGRSHPASTQHSGVSSASQPQNGHREPAPQQTHYNRPEPTPRVKVEEDSKFDHIQFKREPGRFLLPPYNTPIKVED